MSGVLNFNGCPAMNTADMYSRRIKSLGNVLVMLSSRLAEEKDGSKRAVLKKDIDAVLDAKTDSERILARMKDGELP